MENKCRQNKLRTRARERYRDILFRRLQTAVPRRGDQRRILLLVPKYLNTLKRENRVDSYGGYNNSIQAVRKFQANKGIFSGVITPELLRKFEEHLLTKKGASKRKVQTGVNETPSRNLRAIYPSTSLLHC